MIEESNQELKAEEEILRSNLATLDGLITEDSVHKIAAIDLGTARNCIQQIQDTLKKSPILDSIMINRDVRHIIMFIHETRDTFMAASSERVEKKATRVVKDAAKTARNETAKSVIAGMFKPGGALSAAFKIPVKDSPPKASSQADIPDSLDAFAKGVMPEAAEKKNVSALDAFAAFTAKMPK